MLITEADVFKQDPAAAAVKAVAALIFRFLKFNATFDIPAHFVQARSAINYQRSVVVIQHIIRNSACCTVLGRSQLL